jgi:hypothetical protein
METITSDRELAEAGFYWRELEGVRALVCRPLEQDGFVNGFSTRQGGVSPMPQDSLSLAGFHDDAASSRYSGATYLIVTGAVLKDFKKFNATAAHLSLSHTSEHAIAQVILER